MLVNSALLVIYCIAPPFVLHINPHFLRKRFYTSGTLGSIRISILAKIPTFIVISWDPWSKKGVNYLSCIERKGVVKTFTVVHKMPRYLLIYHKISFLPYYMFSLQKAKKLLVHQNAKWFWCYHNVHFRNNDGNIKPLFLLPI